MPRDQVGRSWWRLREIIVIVDPFQVWPEIEWNVVTNKNENFISGQSELAFPFEVIITNSYRKFYYGINQVKSRHMSVIKRPIDV
jgi:hypothetical protein